MVDSFLFVYKKEFLQEKIRVFKRGKRYSSSLHNNIVKRENKKKKTLKFKKFFLNRNHIKIKVKKKLTFEAIVLNVFVNETILETRLIATVKKEKNIKRSKVSLFTNSQNDKGFFLIEE